MAVTLDDLTAFNQTEFLAQMSAAMGVDANLEIVATVVTVTYESVGFSVVITESQCSAIFAAQLNTNAEDINCTVTTNSRRLHELEEAATDTKDINAAFQLEAERRRLQDGGCTADISIVFSDMAAANTVKTALDSNGTAEALVAELSSQFSIVATVSPGVSTATVQIITRITPTGSDAIPDITTGAALATITNYITSVGGTIESITSVADTPSPTPAPPTAPTPAPPTGAPTPAPPTATDEQDSTCAMGANALVLASAAFALLNGFA